MSSTRGAPEEHEVQALGSWDCELLRQSCVQPPRVSSGLALTWESSEFWELHPMVPVSCSPMVLTLSQGVISGIAGKLQSFTPLWVLCLLEEIQVHLGIPVHAENI